MFMIYADESGTSNQPVTVVAGAIFDADVHWRAAEAMIGKAIQEFVPPALQRNFLFHAADVWYKYRDHAEWTAEKRVEFISAIASIPRRLNSAIALGKVRRDALPILAAGEQRDPAEQINLEEQHAAAFRLCLGRANQYVQDFGRASEMGVFVAEDITSKRQMLKKTINEFMPALEMTAEVLHLSAEERRTGRITQRDASGVLDRIVDTVHLAQKHEAPLLQIADACAYSFSRFFARGRYGDQLVESMLGHPLNFDDFDCGSSSSIFTFHRMPAFPVFFTCAGTGPRVLVRQLVRAPSD